MKKGARIRIGRATGHSLFAVLALCSLASAQGCAQSPEQRSQETARRHLSRGDLELARGRPEEAELEYSAAYVLRPDDAAASLGLARALAAQGRAAEALIRYDDVRARDPGQWSEVDADEICPVLVELAALRLAEHAGTEALALTSRAREEGCAAGQVDPVRAGALLEVAGQQPEVDPSAALELCQEAVAADPTRAEAWRCAGELLVGGGAYEEALLLLSEALRHHPRDRELQILMVDALARRAPTAVPGQRP